MEKRGTKPKPLAVLRLRGKDGTRARVSADLPAKPGAPECPAWLSKNAKLIWVDMVKRTVPLGILSQHDRDALAVHCDAVDDYAAACRTIQREGLTVQGKFGTIPHAAVAIKTAAFSRMSKTISYFGLSPSSRVGLGKGARVKDDKESKNDFMQTG